MLLQHRIILVTYTINSIFQGGAYAACSITGGYAVYNGYKIYILRNIIKEHKQVRDAINNTNEFLEKIRDDVVENDLNDSSQHLILQLFEEFRDEVEKLRSELPSSFQ
jgi:hypothetical protein